MSLDKAYDPNQIEKGVYESWENAGYFAPHTRSGSAYCIMIPPPNVTGSLHMGHAFQQTLMDILIRYHRMKGDNTLWQVGTDHAGIATQMVVERQCLAHGKSRQELGREAFVKKIWDWKAESGGNITRQLRRIGASVDWESECFTLDPTLSKAVTEVFTRLYDEGLIYRGKRLVNWDPVLKTAVSDLEVESTEEQGSLWYIRYPLPSPEKGEGSTAYITVATTRPETLLGDVAIAVHPEDDRFASLIGQHVQLPLTNRLIPIIADTSVDPKFGTGCVKITPAHDFNDYAMGQRHGLPAINLFTVEAKLNENAPIAYQGLDRLVAREKIVSDLTALNLIEKIEPHQLNIPRGDKSGAILEPLLTDQWFIKIESLAKPAIEAVEKGHIRFVPENWSKTYFEWMHNIQDWCISRQLWWGHRIPAWYDPAGNIYVGKDIETVRLKYHLADTVILTQDEDVLDTWFSSALWPFSTLGWPDKTQRLETFYPTQVLVTGFDIIFFWVARMIMFGLKFTNEVPFHEVYIHGLIQDENGQKMSKTKGNVLDPIDLIDGIDLETLVKKRTSGMMQPQLAKAIEKTTRTQFPDGISAYGTDALRFTFAALATSGRHIRFDLARVEGYRHFCNKLWNAARYVLLNQEEAGEHHHFSLHTVDQWILSRWQHTKFLVEKQLAEYRFDLASKALYDFTWNEYCDWYLELSKPMLQNAAQNPSAAASTRHTLHTILEELLRAIHPFMPYITEAIWKRLSAKTTGQADTATIMLQSYPEGSKALLDPTAEADVSWIQAVILAIRNIRGEMNISPNKKVPLFFYQADAHDKEHLERYQPLLQALAKLSAITLLSKQDPRPVSATALVGSLEILIPMADLIDKEAEIARLQKEIDKIQKELDKIQQKLSNTNFVQNAPQAVVLQEQNRLDEFTTMQKKLFGRLTDIKNMENP